MNVVIPANTTAKIYVPNFYQIIEDGITVWQNGTYYSNATGVINAVIEDDYVKFEVLSGSYSFNASGLQSTVGHSAADVTYSGRAGCIILIILY